MIKKNYYRLLIPTLIFLFCSSLPVHAEEDFEIKFTGIPLQYEKLLNYDQPYPKIEGFYVRKIIGNDPAVKNGLRLNNIIHSVNGKIVKTRADIREIAVNNFGETVTMTVYKMSPRYKKKIRDNPFYKADSRDFYEEKKLKVLYRRPKEEVNPVVAGPTRKLFHNMSANHSPDTETNTVYKNPNRARRDDLKSCPVCFPSGGSGSLESIVQNELLGSSKYVKKFTKGDQKVTPTPKSLKSLVEELKQHNLRSDLDISPHLFHSNRMYAFGLPSGKLILSNNLYQYAETEQKRAFLLAHLIAHSDRKHEYSPVQEKQFRSLIERAVERTTGFGLDFSQLKEWSPRIPGFGYYHEIIEQGYGDAHEREAIFLSMVIGYKAGYDLNGIQKWLDAKRDMFGNVHENWLDYLLIHPLPGTLNRDIRRWKQKIPENFHKPLRES